MSSASYLGRNGGSPASCAVRMSHVSRFPATERGIFGGRWARFLRAS
jgi:hypothetical protein